MKKKLLAALISAAMVATLLAGCGGGGDTTTTDTTTDAAETEETTDAAETEETADAEATTDNSGLHLEIVSKGLQHAYWQAVLNGVNSKAEELGVSVNFVGPDSESNIQQQVQQLETALNADPSAIGLAALDTNSVMDLLQTAVDSGIPIVGFDSGVPGAPEGAIVANCSTDNLAAGGIAAQEVYKLISDRIANAEGTVRIGVVAQDATSESVVNRGLGFIQEMASLVADSGKTVGMASVSNERYVTDSGVEVNDEADVVIEVRVPASVTSELSAADASAILEQEDTIAIYGSNEHSANGIITANENLNKCGTGEGQVIAAGFDSGASIMNAVRSGVFAGAVTQAPVAMGEYLVETLVAAANGETVEDIDTGCQWYTAENMDDPKIAQNLYE